MPFEDEEDPTSVFQTNPADSASDGLAAAIQESGWQVQAVNWVYEQVTGQNLVETLITPITGDFAKIEANAQAWTEVGDALSAVRKNLNAGISELRESWHGGAASAFETMMVGTWTVALEADGKVADLVGMAFQKAADASRQMCDKALQLIEKLVNRLIETAATGWVPVAGWANVVRNVMKCVDIAMTIWQIYQALEEMYNSVQELIKSVQDTGTSLMKIKDANSLGDAVNAGFETYENASAVGEHATAVRDQGTQVKDGATHLKDTVRGGSSGGSGYQTAMSGNL